MKYLILHLLHRLARACIRRHSPFVIGVTGTIGKTTARNIITEILRKCGRDVWTPSENYNGEWGLPMAILRVTSPGKNIFGWIGLFTSSLRTIYRKTYPKILVLEYGIDHSGEMEFQTSIVEPDIALITTLAPSHLIGFPTEQAYFDEKEKLLARKTKDTFAICNADDPHQKNFITQKWYGKNTEKNDCKIGDVEESIAGIRATITLDNGAALTLTSPILGAHHIGLLAGSLLVARQMGIAPNRAIDALRTIDLPYGRGNILHGINDSLIIDGTYNGGFLPILAGVRMTAELARLSKRKTIAIIGDMRELGPLEISRHEELWRELREIPIDYYIFVGEICERVIMPIISEKLTIEQTEKKRKKLLQSFFGAKIPHDNWSEYTYFTRNSREAGERISEILTEDAIPYLIFAKGSQNTIYLEEAITKIIVPHERSKLVRNTDVYRKKKEQFFSQLGKNIEK